MNITYLSGVELYEEWFASNPKARMKTNFVAFEETPPTYSSVIYMVMDAGGVVGAHTDNLEELILIVEGTVTAQVGEETATLATGGILLVPAGVTHELRNAGDTPARAVGFFASPSVVTTFREPLMPGGKNLFGTPSVS